jgi:hypothetical protein
MAGTVIACGIKRAPVAISPPIGEPLLGGLATPHTVLVHKGASLWNVSHDAPRSQRVWRVARLER